MSYLGLARKYRPGSFERHGRVYESTRDEPWETTVEPFYAHITPHGVFVRVSMDGQTRERYLPIPELVTQQDAPVIFETAQSLAEEIDPNWIDHLHMDAGSC